MSFYTPYIPLTRYRSLNIQPKLECNFEYYAVSFFNALLGYRKFYYHDEAVIMLCALLFPKLGKIRLARILDLHENKIAAVLRTTDSPSVGCKLTNPEDRCQFFHEVAHDIVIQYNEETISIDKVRSILRTELPVLNAIKPSLLYCTQHIFDAIQNGDEANRSDVTSSGSNVHTSDDFLNNPPLALNDQAFWDFFSNAQSDIDHEAVVSQVESTQNDLADQPMEHYSQEIASIDPARLAIKGL